MIKSTRVFDSPEEFVAWVEQQSREIQEAVSFLAMGFHALGVSRRDACHLAYDIVQAKNELAAKYQSVSKSQLN